MKGSMSERNGSYRLKIPLGKNPTSGKYDSYYETFKGTRTQAQKRLRELLTQLDKGIFVKPGKQTVMAYLQSWLQDSLPNMTPRNYEGYEFNTCKYIIPALGQIHITELKPPHIQHLISEKQAEGHFRTAQYIYNTLNRSLNTAVKMGFLVRNPCDGVDPPKVPRREMHVMSESDVNIFLEDIHKSPYYALFYTDLFTGMRRSELLAIQWKSVDLELCLISVNRTMHVPLTGRYKGQIIFKQPKTGKSRRLIDLTPSNAIVLREYRETQNNLRISLGLPELKDGDLVFCHYDGSPYLPDSITHAWMILTRRSGLKGIRLHDARHTMATIMLEHGIHPKIVQERLGHASIKTTLDTYSHVAPGLQKAAALKFDDILQPKTNKLDKELKEITRN